MQRHLYHGSEAIIEKPVYGVGKSHNDYGPGFYCTNSKKLAAEWATRLHGSGFVNEYSLRDDKFSVLDLTKPPYDDVLHWIALLMENRHLAQDLRRNYPRELEYLKNNYLLDASNYDVVIGYRADDAYFKFPESFVRSEITLESLRKIYLAGDLGKQYVLVSERAFNNLHFLGYEEVTFKSRGDYYARISAAGRLHQELLAQDRYAVGTRLIDLVWDK